MSLDSVNRKFKFYDLKAKCTFNKKIYDIIIKNPHTLHFFCDIQNIIICEDKSNLNKNKNLKKCSKGIGYIFHRRPTPPLHTKNMFTNLNLLSMYKKDSVPILLKDIEYKIDFQARKQLPATTIHWGQMKLFLSTLQFLLNYCPSGKKVNILYVGSAEGHNIPLLVDMFPNTEWYLVDPRKDKNNKSVFDKRLYKLERVKEIITDYFTDDLAKKMSKKLNKEYFLFISDIRLFKQVNRNKKEDDIDTDMVLQKEWYKILNPDYTQLKFRIPYNKPEYNYLDGEIYLQDYAPVSSTETRLVVKKNSKMKKYLLQEYEGKLFYFNRLLRTSYYKHNYNIDCIDHCYDCTKFTMLINKYNKYNPNYYKNKSIKKIIEHVIKEIKTTNVLERETIKILEHIQT